MAQGRLTERANVAATVRHWGEEVCDAPRGTLPGLRTLDGVQNRGSVTAHRFLTASLQAPRLVGVLALNGDFIGLAR